MTKTRLICGATLLLLMTGFANGEQVLVNGNLESGSISPWTSDFRFGSGTGWSITSSGCFDGSFCAIDTGNVALKQTFAGVDTSTITDVSFYMNNAIGLAAVDFFYQGGGDDEFTPSTTNNVWTFVDETSHLRANDTLVGFEVFGNTSNAASRLDDLSITASVATPEPGTMLLFGTGLAAMIAAVRHRRSA